MIILPFWGWGQGWMIFWGWGWDIISYRMEGTASKIEEEVELKPKISPELVKKYREVFDGFDKEQDGYVQAKDVPGVLRILGVVMTEQ